MAETSIDIPAFYAAIDQKRKNQDLSWRGLAQQLEITPSDFHAHGPGSSPRL